MIKNPVYFLVAIVFVLSFDACKRDDSKKTREIITLFREEFEKPNTWIKYKWNSSEFVQDTAQSLYVNGALELRADGSHGCDQEKAERNFHVTPNIQEALNTNDTMFFSMVSSSSIEASGQLSAIFQFNNFNLRIELENEPRREQFDILLVNWVVKEVKRDSALINNYNITASKGTVSGSGAIIVANACAGDTNARAALGIERFSLSYPKSTID